MSLGVWFFFYLIVAMGAFFNLIDMKSRVFTNKCLFIRQFCTQGKIDTALKNKMLKMLKYKMKKEYFAVFKVNSILGDIPLKLRYETAMNMNNGILSNFAFFNSLDSSLLGSIVVCLRSVYLNSGEVIDKRGDSANESNYL